MDDTWKNKLWYGDNLEVIREHLAAESIDLIYLDPPFNSKSRYNIPLAEGEGPGSDALVEAFADTWRWGPDSEEACREMAGASGEAGELGALIQALRGFWGNSNMMAYLVMIAVRLAEMHRVLKPTGTIYLHCDPVASHYLKLVLDAVFGIRHFQNEIIWSYRSGGGTSKRYGRKHDVLLFYSKSPRFTFNGDAVRVPYDAVIAEKRRHLFSPLGKVPGDVWEISRPPNHTKEWLGYPTQKPEALLDRIIRASSSPGDLVLDPFCGCGTTLAVSQRLGRRWIGIDTSRLAISLASRRLRDASGGGGYLVPFEVLGWPEDPARDADRFGATEIDPSSRR